MEAKPKAKEDLNKESVYVCEVCLKSYKSYRHLGDYRRCAHKLPFRQPMLGINFDIDSFDLHPGKSSSSFLANADSVYVCEICKNDYQTFAKLKYHRKNTHNVSARQVGL